MVVKRQCSFCANEIEPGTGTMFVKRDGSAFHFCSSSCRKQQMLLGRVGHHLKWTRAHALKRAADQSSAAGRKTAAAARPAATAPSSSPKKAGRSVRSRPAPAEGPAAPKEGPAAPPAPAAPLAEDETVAPAKAVTPAREEKAAPSAPAPAAPSKGGSEKKPKAKGSKPSASEGKVGSA